MSGGFAVAAGLGEDEIQTLIDDSLAAVGSGDLSAVSLRRANPTPLSILATMTPFDAETVDIENEPTVLEAGPTTGQILIKDAGLHLIFFEQEFEAPASSNYVVNGDILNNGVSVPGGVFDATAFNDGSIPGSNVPGRLVHYFVGDLAVGNISAEVASSLTGGTAGTVSTLGAGTFAAIRLSGAKGDKGDDGDDGLDGLPGTGSTINVQETGETVIGGVSTLKFLTDDFDVIDEGSGIIRVESKASTSSSVYGEGFDSDRNNVADISGGAGNWETHTSIVYVAPSAGTYEIGVSYQSGMDNSADQDFLTRLLIDGASTLDGFDSRTEHKDANGTGPGNTNQRVPSMLKDEIVLTAGQNITFEFQFSSSGGAFATCWFSRMKIKRVV